MTDSVFRRLLLVYLVLHIAFDVAGLIVNPDFSVGAEATSKRLLGVDFNGWHALAGLSLWLPGLYAVRRTRDSVIYCWAVSGLLLLTALVTFFTDRPLNLLYFPNELADQILHFGSAAVFIGLVLARRGSREPAS